MPRRAAAKRKRKINLKDALSVWSAHLNKARQKKISPERRREIAMIAITARWAKRDAQRAAGKASENLEAAS